MAEAANSEQMFEHIENLKPFSEQHAHVMGASALQAVSDRITPRQPAGIAIDALIHWVGPIAGPHAACSSRLHSGAATESGSIYVTQSSYDTRRLSQLLL